MSRGLRTALIAVAAVAAWLAVAWAGDRGRAAGRPVAGVVRDAEGRAIPAVEIEVEGLPKSWRVQHSWRTDVHGRFQTSALSEGPAVLLVKAGGPRAHSAATRVETRAGVRDLVIVLDPGPQLLLHLVDYVPGQQERWARVRWVEPDGSWPVRYAPIRKDGWVCFVALPLDRELELWAETEGSRRHVVARGLKPSAQEQRIEPVEVMEIAGRVRGTRLFSVPTGETRGLLRDAIRVDVFAPAAGTRSSGLLVTSTRLERDGSFRVRGLPPGTYEVSVGTHAGDVWSVEKSVKAGPTDVIFDLD